MRLGLILAHYCWWHYTGAIADLARIGKDALSWLADFFSVRFLFAHLFAPIKRLGEAYPQGLDIPGFFSSLIVNTLMRAVGFLFRVVLILFGLTSIAAGLAVFFLVLFAWLALPFLLLFLFVFGVKLLMA